MSHSETCSALMLSGSASRSASLGARMTGRAMCVVYSGCTSKSIQSQYVIKNPISESRQQSPHLSQL